jgi:hypothetical protein
MTSILLTNGSYADYWASPWNLNPPLVTLFIEFDLLEPLPITKSRNQVADATKGLSKVYFLGFGFWVRG